MSIWQQLVIIGAAGVVGGSVNSLLIDQPTKEFLKAQHGNWWLTVYLKNALVGAVAALVVACTNSALGQIAIGSGQPTPPLFTVGEIAGAFVVGLGGGNILAQRIHGQALSRRIGQLEMASKGASS
jgi:hypothetical protein